MNKLNLSKIFQEGLESFKKNQFDEAILKFNHILKVDPKSINTLLILSQIYKKKGDLLNYEKLLNEINKLDPANYQVLNNLGGLYKKKRNLSLAENCFRKSIQINNNYDKALFNLALLNEEKGKLSDATKYYLQAIDCDKNIPSYYFNLLRLDKSFIKKIDFSFIKKLSENTSSLDPKEKAYACFIMSIYAKQNKNIEEEIKYLDKGHSLFYSSDTKNKISTNFWIDILPKVLKKKKVFKPLKKEKKNEKLKPIFVFGLPRSGTSLIETLISSGNKKIYNASETLVIPNSIFSSVIECEKKKNFELDLNDLSDKINLEYLKLFTQDNNNYIHFVDKTLENFFFTDLILELFPNSKLILCERNRFDNFVAIYQQCLTELPWTHNVNTILNYFNKYDEALKLNRTKSNKNILTIKLHDLTNDPVKYSKKIFSFCNLEWSEGVLEFYKRNDLFLNTASNIQLRQKIFKTDKKKFESYKPYFKKYFKDLDL